MLNSLQELSENALHYESISSYITCPYRFYYHNQLDHEDNQYNWLLTTQQAINKVVSDFFMLNVHERTSLKVLQLFNHYWGNVDKGSFNSVGHYYTTVAKVIDHLIQFLMQECESTPPLFLFEKVTACHKKLNRIFNLTIDVASWSPNSYVVKKYLVQVKEDMLDSYWSTITYFSKLAFGEVPERIEVISLENGIRYTYTPRESELRSSMLSNCFTCNNQNACFENE
ncbi:hypothetical protein [Bacillus sp. FJAT-45350]|uniref:hypothetical protein n=1 Tax=Bacillus sp. FJAT-45350 TaxID=2011014 RepID=UPI000BB7128F|nr:hypothetical protein [Bacillus sp. FJAT-45350]